jgi:hypothetical protein
MESGGGSWDSVSILAILGVAIPLVVAALTLVVGVYNQNRQSKRDFELKVLEVLMAETSPVAVRNKARAFKTLFPHAFSSDFAANFNPADFEGPAGEVDAKKYLIGLIAEHPEAKELIVETWKQLFPSDTWIKAIR